MAKAAKYLLGIDVPGGREGGWALIKLPPARRWPAGALAGPSYVTSGGIRLDVRVSEAEQIRQLDQLFAALATRYPLVEVAIEHAFLFRIAGWVGVIKTLAAQRGVPWYMLTATHARKQIFGSGRAKGKEAKLDTLTWALAQTWGKPRLTQHEADALLYAWTAWKTLAERPHAA